MTRTYAAAVNSYLSEPLLDFRLLANITFTNTTMRLHTGVGSLMVGATHYDGIGNLGGIERIAENADSFSGRVTLWMTAVESASLNEVLNETLFNNPVELHRCWLDNGTIVNTPEKWYSGVMGEIHLHRADPERGNYIEVVCQTKLDRQVQPTYYTTEDQWQTYSGDTFFEYLHQIQNQKALWGQKATYLNNARNTSRGWSAPIQDYYHRTRRR